MATSNMHLEETALSQTFGQWLDAFNSNMSKIDALPIPMEYGKNTTMEYLKFTNGKVIMFGRIELGTKYPCYKPFSKGYLSDTITIDFPIALTKNNPVVIPHVMADKFQDLTLYTQGVTYTTYKGCVYGNGNDSTVGNSKTLNIMVIGDWK